MLPDIIIFSKTTSHVKKANNYGIFKRKDVSMLAAALHLHIGVI